MSKPAMPANDIASPPRPPDPARARMVSDIRRILADNGITDLQRAQRIAAVADEYAAHLIEKHARPAWIGGAA